jgi:hypothetical protein
MNNPQEKEELGHKYLCLTMNNSISNNTQELSKKEKRAAYNKKYYISNKQLLAAQHQTYQEKHKDKIKEYHKKYRKDQYEANKEKEIAQNRVWAEKNREKTRAYNKVWRERNKQLQTEADKEKKQDYHKDYREANRENIRSCYKEWNEAKKKDPDYQAKLARDRKQRYEANKEKVLAKCKEYRKANSTKLSKQDNKRRKQRMKEDPLFFVKSKLRRAVIGAFKRIKHNKPSNTQSLLGCTWEEAKAHFESLFQEGMSWENHGEWHIDHVRPVASFAQDELYLMNHISNLQPLWAKDNLQKSDDWV